MKSIFARCGAVLVFAGVMATGNPFERVYWYKLEDGTRWRAGCVDPEDAEFLIERLGFNQDEGGPGIRCALPYVFVAKKYGH